MKIKAKTIEEYIHAAPTEAKQHLRELRALLKEVAPQANEMLKWGNPVFEENRILFAYAAYKDHMNFMPTPAVLDMLKAELKGHKVGKGSIQLPYTEPLPKKLIQKMAKLRVKDARENDARWM